VAGPDFDTEIKQLLATMSIIDQVLDLDGMRREIAELGEPGRRPGSVGRPGQRDARHRAPLRVQGELNRFTEPQSRIGDLQALLELGQEEDDAASMAAAEVELAKINKSVEAS